MKPVMDKITRASDKVCYYVSFLSMAVAVIMMVLVTVDVFLGKVFGIRIAGTYEVVQVLLSTLVFSSWAYTQSVHGHIHVVMFISKFPQKLRFLAFGLTSALSVATVCFGAYAVFQQIFSVKASGECTTTLLIPFWPFYIFQFVAFVLLTVVMLIDTVKAFGAMVNNDLAEEVQSSWV